MAYLPVPAILSVLVASPSPTMEPPEELESPEVPEAFAESPRENEAPDPDRTEVGILPAINFDSDLGFGFGLLTVVAKFSPNKKPFDWRIAVLAFATARDDGDGLEFPFHSDFVQFDIPQLFDRRLRLTGEVAFRKFSNAGYHGFGSRSQRVEAGSDATEAERNFHTYDRIYPSITANARWQLIDRPVEVGKWRLEVFGGTRLMYNAFNIYESSLLERDVLRVRSSDPASETLRDLLLGTNDHFLWLLNAGFLFDTRDQEFAPTRGTFSELSGRFSPGVDADLVYGGVTLSTSWFASLYRDYLVLAGRFVFDAQFGNVPFYEQTFFGTFSPQDGPAGGGAVRGVVRQRFAGRVKTVGNLELRSQLLPFELFGAKFNVGLTAFFDAGRVWADFETRTLDGENLDDPFLTFEAGTGGGLRLRWGQTFIIRADFAYSPTQDTTGLYIDVGHIF